KAVAEAAHPRFPPVCSTGVAPVCLPLMKTGRTIDANTTMRELLEHYPGAQRALFRRYHVGGCASCGFSPDETLAGVCARNANLDPGEAITHIVESDTAERAMQIEPRELAVALKEGGTVRLLDVRTREEHEAVKIDGAELFTHE